MCLYWTGLLKSPFSLVGVLIICNNLLADLLSKAVSLSNLVSSCSSSVVLTMNTLDLAWFLVEAGGT
jgi:hypothetical protein